jgi:hypothetical protein
MIENEKTNKMVFNSCRKSFYKEARKSRLKNYCEDQGRIIVGAHGARVPGPRPKVA